MSKKMKTNIGQMFSGSTSPLVFNPAYMFFFHSLILSLEAKLNLLHNYMNVTWIRIPSETRVTFLFHMCVLFVTVN